MRKDRKGANCLNCGQPLPNQENYCPNCGQENKDQRVSISIFMEDFISSYFSFDSSFFKTFRPFLFKPGHLTEAFNNGKRREYIHPIRLYLIFSLFYFFVLGLSIPTNFLDNILNSGTGDVRPMNSETKNGEQIIKDPELRQDIDSLSVLYADNVNLRQKWKDIKFAALDPEMSDEDFEQQLQRNNINIQSISIEKKRAFVANSGLFVANSAKNLPIMMFLLLPFFAGFLMLLHLRSTKYYVEHLIHGLNLHSFAYLIYGTSILIISFTGNALEDWLILLSFLIVTAYAYLSVKHIYKNGWLKAFVKFFILGVFYFTLLVIATGLELYFSLSML